MRTPSSSPLIASTVLASVLAIAGCNQQRKDSTPPTANMELNAAASYSASAHVGAAESWTPPPSVEDGGSDSVVQPAQAPSNTFQSVGVANPPNINTLENYPNQVDGNLNSHPYKDDFAGGGDLAPKCKPIDTPLPRIDDEYLNVEAGVCMREAIALVACGDNLWLKHTDCLEEWRQQCGELVDGDGYEKNIKCTDPAKFYAARRNGPLEGDYK